MQIYDLPVSWDAKKFALRYALDNHRDFYVNGDGKLTVFPVLPDNPPIFDAPDPYVAVPPGVKVHHCPEMIGWVGNKKIIHAEDGAPHYECYYIIADDKAALVTLQGMPNVGIVEGQPAYIKDKKELRVWTGTAWKKP